MISEKRQLHLYLERPFSVTLIYKSKSSCTWQNTQRVVRLLDIKKYMCIHREGDSEKTLK